MNQTYLLLAALFLYSCSSNIEKSNETSVKNTFDLVESEKITVPLDNTTANQFDLIQYVENINSEFIIVENKKLKTLNFYSLNNDEFNFKIELDSVLQVYGINDMEGFYFHNLDSIFIFRKYTLDKFLLIDQKLIKVKLIKSDVRGYYNHTSRTRNPPHFYNNSLYNLIIPNIDFSHLDNFNDYIGIESEIDLVSLNSKFLDITYPEDYEGNSWGMSHAIPCRTINSKNELVYSFGITPDIYVFNLQTEKVSKRTMNSDVSVKITPMNIEDPIGLQYLEYFIEQDFFSEILYDKYRKVYYRIIKKGMNFTKSNGENQIWENKPSILLVLDEGFNQIAKYNLEPYNKFYVRDIFVGREGLYISNNHPENTNINEDFAIFSLLKLIKK